MLLKTVDCLIHLEKEECEIDIHLGQGESHKTSEGRHQRISQLNGQFGLELLDFKDRVESVVEICVQGINFQSKLILGQIGVIQPNPDQNEGLDAKKQLNFGFIAEFKPAKGKSIFVEHLEHTHHSQ